MAKVNIYSPTYHRFEKTKVAVSSIIDTINSSENDVRYFLCDNNSPQEMKDWLVKQDKDNDKVETFLSPVNYGKAKLVNQVHSKARDCDYVISIDSDMRNTHLEYNWIDELVKIMGNVPKLGVLSTFQEGSNCHHLHALPHTHVVNLPNKTTHKIKYGHFGGVAGGCIILRTREFNSFGMYTIRDVYNADDALIMRKCNEVLKKVVAVSETIALEHMVNEPSEKDYQEWKIKKSKGEIPNGEDTKGFYDK